MVPASEAQFIDAINEIKRAGVIGFDSESKPTFAKGEVSTGPHIVQFALVDKAFIFQLCQPYCSAFLIEILDDAKIEKVGFGLSSDREQIYQKLGCRMSAVTDLNSIFRANGYKSSTGVRAAVAIVLQQNFHKSKRVSTSNWSRVDLTPQQLLYAANDAYAAHAVAMAIKNLSVPWPE
jgi:ribonuclease D